MSLFALPERPMDEAGTAGGGAPGALSPELQQAINEEINKALTGYMKRELPKVFQSQMGNLTEAFMDRLAQELPSDEEIAQMEQEEAAQYAAANQGEDPGGGGDFVLPPEINAELLELRNARAQADQRLAELEQARQEAEILAEMKDREAEIARATAAFPFANSLSQQLFAQYLSDKLERDENGQLVAEGLPLSTYAENQLQVMSNLLAPKNLGGSGAFQGNGLKQKAPTMDQIGAGQKPEERQAVMDYAIQQLKGGGHI